MPSWALGIDLGGTNIKVAVVGESEGILFEDTQPTDAAAGPEGVVRQLAFMADAIYQRAAEMLDTGFFAGIGLGAPGAVDAEKGTLSYPPNLPGWGRYDLRDQLQMRLEQAYGLFSPVIIENDANAAAYGEAIFGGGNAFRDFMLVTLGTGVGGGIILDRKLYRGPTGTAGEIGFMIIDFEGERVHAGIRGTIEGLIGKERIVELACSPEMGASRSPRLNELCSRDFSRLSPRHLEQAAKEGDAAALRTWERIGTILGVGLANITALMDIRKFVIGGGIAAAGELIFKPAMMQLHRSTLPSMHDGLEIVPARLGNKAGIYGAAALCFNSVQSSNRDA
ncbi:ROK family protein [Chlorobaculum sp. MV4-Y]|uniref:ROK family protein n=1 Tax=Chlorobaculum sp. MV4-Y TaxID=2976335 RepID=UPI0021AF10E3|nr:ROK family protein [Chlorobaculum sp. MV4-Y]UWX57386.1 ROK family protein [Chlorobaculum sp. MV4-Y]